jgi:hypothetical protein
MWRLVALQLVIMFALTLSLVPLLGNSGALRAKSDDGADAETEMQTR